MYKCCKSLPNSRSGRCVQLVLQWLLRGKDHYVEANTFIGAVDAPLQNLKSSIESIRPFILYSVNYT